MSNHEHDWVLVEQAAEVTYYECRVDGCNVVREERLHPAEEAS